MVEREEERGKERGREERCTYTVHACTCILYNVYVMNALRVNSST